MDLTFVFGGTNEMSMMDALKMLYGDNNVSKCCKSKFFVQYGGEATSYYVCKKCHKACDLLPIGVMDGK